METLIVESKAKPITESARVNELKGVKIEGFTAEREVFVRGLLERTGLPLDRVTSVTYKPNDRNHHVLGQAQIETGKLYFYKNMERLPKDALEISQLEVATHELFHINTPFYEECIKVYGSENNMKKAAENTIRVAKQTKETRLFLSGYHEWLYGELQKGTLNGGEQTFIEETNAIMMSLRISNPKHLEKIVRSQNSNNADDILNQIDQTLLNMMPQFNSISEVNHHFTKLKKDLRANII